MLTLYFSGTGNSKYVAERFAAGMDCDCRSIEEAADFGALIRAADSVAFVYPVYCSRVPRILREFVKAHTAELYGKKLVILCTQMEFSGDGARCFTDLLPRRAATVLYAEHILMPNNISNFLIFHKTAEKRIQQLSKNADRTVARICADIKAGRIRKRGFNVFSRFLGFLQGMWQPMMEWAMNGTVRIGSECTGCGLCVQRCPMKNLTLENGKAVAHGNCTECYRCINLCPARAVRILFRRKPKWQFQGIKNGPQ